ncbi:hypothetical protein F5Y18DRAFT_404567 [Xylariaceae sp. FL1019]|nr:hypothetical protein F5Y18DRAFT_404567 [Xylariaceae sp. FL1019]
MQKILKRVRTAERVAAKRKAKKEQVYYNYNRRQTDDQEKQSYQIQRDEIKESKQSIRDDWKYGPNAARTDVGEKAHARGAIHEIRFSGATSDTITLAQRNRRCQWAGGVYSLCLKEKDRVVVLEGPDKGKIGTVSNIRREHADLFVEGLNKANIHIGEITRADNPGNHVATLELPLPISAVRLVHPILDEATGQTRDVIINQILPQNLVTDRLTGERRWNRVVPGLNISIPWPEKKPEEHPIHKGDTLRIDVEEKTFVPTLLRPPMPEKVIDELRNKYSRFRTRHEPEYIAKLEAEMKEKEDRKLLMKSMETPLQELHKLERENKKKKGKPRLSVEMLEKIGEVIAKNREMTLKGVGVEPAKMLGDVEGTMTMNPSGNVIPDVVVQAEMSKEQPTV